MVCRYTSVRGIRSAQRSTTIERNCSRTSGGTFGARGNTVDARRPFLFIHDRLSAASRRKGESRMSSRAVAVTCVVLVQLASESGISYAQSKEIWLDQSRPDSWNRPAAQLPAAPKHSEPV